jgi:hypothetical protein
MFVTDANLQATLAADSYPQYQRERRPTSKRTINCTQKSATRDKMHAYRAMCMRNTLSHVQLINKPSSSNLRTHTTQTRSNPTRPESKPLTPDPKSFKASHSSLPQAQAQQAHSPAPTAKTVPRQPVYR